MLSTQHQYHHTESRNGQQPSFAITPSIHTPQRGATKAAHGKLTKVLGTGGYGIACKFAHTSMSNGHTAAYKATFEFNMHTAENYAIKIIRSPYPERTYRLARGETQQKFFERFHQSVEKQRYENESTHLRLKDLKKLQREEYFLKKYHFGNTSNIGIFIGEPSSTISFNLVSSIIDIYYSPAIALSAPLAQGISVYNLTDNALQNIALSLGVLFHILKNIIYAFKNIHTDARKQFAHLDGSTANYMVNLEKNCQVTLIDFGMAENLYTPTGEKSKIAQMPTDPADIETYIFHRRPRFQEYNEEVRPALVEIGPEDDAFAVARGIKDLCGKYLEQDNNSQYIWLNSLSKFLELFMAKLNQIHKISNGYVYPATMDNAMDTLLIIVLLTETLEALSAKQNLHFDTNNIEQRDKQLETAEKQLAIITSALGTSPENEDTIQINKKLGAIKKDLALIKKIKQTNQESEETLTYIEPSTSPDTVASGIHSPELPSLTRSLSPTAEAYKQHLPQLQHGPTLDELRKELSTSDSFDSLAYSDASTSALTNSSESLFFSIESQPRQESDAHLDQLDKRSDNLLENLLGN